MINYTTTQTEEELEQILTLQSKNLPSALSSTTQLEEGFLTVQHDFDLLKRMHLKCPHIIAKNNKKVIGYALCMHPDFCNEIEVLKPMFHEINLRLECEKFIIMGQICIDTVYRKMGIFRNLYEVMRAEVMPPFSQIITEVDAVNTRSLQAHHAIGFKDLSTYKAGGQEWVLIGLE